MKIENSNRTNTVPAPTTPVARGAKQTSQSGAGVAQDNVQLSSMSTQLQALETSIKEASGFDAGKVEGIKQAIDDGNYTVNAEAIANKLISSTQELLAQQKG